MYHTAFSNFSRNAERLCLCGTRIFLTLKLGDNATESGLQFFRATLSIPCLRIFFNAVELLTMLLKYSCWCMYTWLQVYYRSLLPFDAI